MILEIIITGLCIGVIFASYLLLLALRRINDYENYIIQIQEVVEYGAERMSKVDSSGHYESDDETQFFFEELKQIQDILNNLFELNQEVTHATEKSKEKE